MGIDPQGQDEPHRNRRTDEPPRGNGVIIAFVALAMILAIGFFYLTDDRRHDGRADAVTNAAQSVDETVKMVGDAAKDAADTLRKDQ